MTATTTIDTEAKAAAKHVADVIEAVADVYLDACRAGRPQREVYDACRAAFESQWGLPPVMAANWARMVIAIVGAKVGEQVYTPADFERILAIALGCD